ncbi:MAG: hypothetical protein AAGE59_19830 [Cyanobacteria bacterium P01_F01_bin.86]
MMSAETLPFAHGQTASIFYENDQNISAKIWAKIKAHKYAEFDDFLPFPQKLGFEKSLYIKA